MTLNGIDISRWQSTTPPLTGLAFAFARATYGTRPDDMYRRHTSAFRAAGLVIGAYHFGVGYLDVNEQVTAFLAAAAPDALLALDLERDAAGTMTNPNAKRFIATVQAKGRKIGLYHSESGFPSLGQDFDWVANWSTAPARHWDFWQYRGSPLDLDHFNGTQAQLDALAGIKPPRPSLWGSDVPAAIQATNTDGWYVAGVLNNLTRLTNSADSFGSVINMPDLAEGFTRGRHVDPKAPTYGKVIEAHDVQALIDWWKAR